MRAYSKDLRLKVLAAVDRGMPRKEVTRVFGVSSPSIERWLSSGEGRAEEWIPNPYPRSSGQERGAARGVVIPTQLKNNPDL